MTADQEQILLAALESLAVEISGALVEQGGGHRGEAGLALGVRGGTAGMWPRLNETLATQAWEPVYFNGADVAPISCAHKFGFRIGDS